MYVEIKSDNLTGIRQGNNGKSYGEQQAALHTGGDFPLPFKLNREQGHALKPGRYTLSPSSFGTDKFGNLVLGRVQLEPAPLVGTKV